MNIRPQVIKTISSALETQVPNMHIVNNESQKIHAILAVDKNGGIGLNNSLPWHCSDELRIFKQKTMNSRLLFGRKTVQNIPNLIGRSLYVLTKNPVNVSRHFKNCNSVTNRTFSSIDQAVENIEKPFFVCGGATIYNQFFSRKLVDVVHMSVMKKAYNCDTTLDIPKLLEGFVITSKEEHEEFTHYTLFKNYGHAEFEYLKLLKRVLMHGNIRDTRNGKVMSMFSDTMRFDTTLVFPLVTTKKMFFRGVVEELLFFLRGDTDTTLLENKNVNIWSGNTRSNFLASRNLPYAEGVMGPMYGYQFRHYNAPYIVDEDGVPVKSKAGIDQLRDVVNSINTDPTSRRLIMTAYNPEQAKEGVLYPCHSLVVQFYVDNKHLDMFCYNRSQDLFLGTPWNIASSALLLMIVAKITGLRHRHLTITVGDHHIYASHIKSVREQLERQPYEQPSVTVPDIPSVDDIDLIKAEDFKLVGYKSHPSIKAGMIA